MLWCKEKMDEAHLSSKPCDAVIALADLITKTKREKKERAIKQKHETLKLRNFVHQFFPCKYDNYKL